MDYHDRENLSVFRTPVSLLPWYHRLWARPVYWLLDMIAGGEGANETS